MGMRAPKNWKHITSAAILELLEALEEEAKLHRNIVEADLLSCCKDAAGYVDDDAFMDLRSGEFTAREQMNTVREWLEDKLLFARARELAKEQEEQERAKWAERQVETERQAGAEAAQVATVSEPKACEDESCEICRAVARRRERDAAAQVQQEGGTA